jgi:hypothetical protein
LVEEDSDEDSDMNMTPEQMALFVRKFNKMFKKSGLFNKNKDKDKIKTKRTSKIHALGVARSVISLRNAQYKSKEKRHQQV